MVYGFLLSFSVRLIEPFDKIVRFDAFSRLSAPIPYRFFFIFFARKDKDDLSLEDCGKLLAFLFFPFLGERVLSFSGRSFSAG